MSPPRAGSGRKPLGRLVDALRRRLNADRAAPPATGPGLGSGEETALSAAARPEADEPVPVADAMPDADSHAKPDESDARFDAARDRLRSTIKPPSDAD